MAQVIYSRGMLSALQRITDFLERDDPTRSEQVIAQIVDAIEVLERHPLIGHGVKEGLRELVISRGRAGYIVLYEFSEAHDRVVLFSIRHPREAGHLGSD